MRVFLTKFVWGSLVDSFSRVLWMCVGCIVRVLRVRIVVW